LISETVSARVIKPDPESTTMLPVVAPPMVSVWLLVVPRLPAPVRNVALLRPPEIEAVGVPELTLVKANLADAVEIPPINRSTVAFFGVSAPFV